MAGSRKARVTLILSFTVSALLATKAAVAFSRYAKAQRSFPSIQIGDSRASVIGKMGRPNYYLGQCGVIHVPGKGCATEFVYSHPFAPLVPEYYIVSFSQDDKVIEADVWDSP